MIDCILIAVAAQVQGTLELPPLEKNMFLTVFLGLAVTSSLFTAVCSQSYPSSVLVPSTSITDVPLSCTGAAPVKWRVNGTLYDSSYSPPGLILMGDVNGSIIQTLTVEQAFILSYNGTAFQCSTNGDDFSIVPTALIIVYSKLLTLSRAHVNGVL